MTSSPTWEANDGSAGVDGSPFHKTKHPKWGVHCPSWENAKRAGSEGWVGGGGSISDSPPADAKRL